jgi:hypothetical protein
LQDDGLFGRALSLGQTFEAIAGNDNAGRSIEAKTGTVIEAGNLFKARVSAAGVAVMGMMVLRLREFRRRGERGQCWIDGEFWRAELPTMPLPPQLLGPGP